MTPFSLLLMISGLSQREAADFLDVSPSSVDKMSRGTRSTPPGVIDELRALIEKQETAARHALDEIKKISAKESRPDVIEIGYPVDDSEAQTLGWPCVGAWCGMAARVIAAAPLPIKTVERGSTPATAAAAVAHGAARRGAG